MSLALSFPVVAFWIIERMVRYGGKGTLRVEVGEYVNGDRSGGFVV
jgi:hypothetical protein